MKYGAERFLGSTSRSLDRGEWKKIRAQERRAAKRQIKEQTNEQK